MQIVVPNMNRMKRKVDDDVTSKRMRCEMNNVIEHLSNELFLEIFDYLDAYHVWKAFSNLNKRFQDLLSSPCLRPKVIMKSNEQSSGFNDQINYIVLHSHQIASLSLHDSTFIDRFFQTIIFDSFFQRLESVVLESLKPCDLLPILIKLIRVPRLNLLMLSVSYDNTIPDFSNVYRIILRLPMLQYSKLRFLGPIPRLLLRNISDQYSVVKRLNLDHACRSVDLIHLLSFTPCLSHLRCGHLKSSDQIIEKLPVSLPYLTYFSLADCGLHFYELEIFVKKLGSQLRTFRILKLKDTTYLDPKRWERLIKAHMSCLSYLHLGIHQSAVDNVEITPHHHHIQGFTSQFWVEHRWIFNIRVFTYEFSRVVILYLIASEKEQGGLDTSGMRSVGVPLVVQCRSTDYYAAHVDNLAVLFTLVQIEKLSLINQTISIGILLDFLRYLPNLTKLFIRSMPLDKSLCLNDEEKEIYRSISTNNQIKSVCLQEVTELTQIQFLIDLCPLLKSLIIGISSRLDTTALLEFILFKNYERVSRLFFVIVTREPCQRTFLTVQNILRSDERYNKHSISLTGKYIQIRKCN